MIKLESITLDTSDNLASSCILSTVKPKGDSAIIIKKISSDFKLLKTDKYFKLPIILKKTITNKTNDDKNERTYSAV